VQPPTNTESLANSRLSSSVRSSQLHSIVARSLLARLGIAAALEQIEALRETLQDLGRGEHSRPGRSQLDRERQVVQPAAQLGDVVARRQL
jgi:hypothetical protein